jgi:hypothetical protein
MKTGGKVGTERVGFVASAARGARRLKMTRSANMSGSEMLAERVGVLETVFPLFADFIRWSPTLSDSATWRNTRFTLVLRRLPPVSDFSASMALEMALGKQFVSVLLASRR